MPHLRAIKPADPLLPLPVTQSAPPPSLRHHAHPDPLPAGQCSGLCARRDHFRSWRLRPVLPSDGRCDGAGVGLHGGGVNLRVPKLVDAVVLDRPTVSDGRESRSHMGVYEGSSEALCVDVGPTPASTRPSSSGPSARLMWLTAPRA